MDFKEFCNRISENILGYFPSEFAEGKVTVDGTMKNNGLFMQGLSIHIPNVSIMPKVYLEGFYRLYENGNSFEGVCQSIADEYQRHMISEIPFDRQHIFDYEYQKSNITAKVLYAKENPDLLRDRPSTRLDDMAVFYQIEVEGMPDGRATIPITNSILENWNVSIEEIHTVAIENSERLFPARLFSLDSFVTYAGMENLLGDAEYQPSVSSLLVLSNSKMNGGSSTIANPDVLRRVSEVINDSFYIVPSSIHEVIVMPKTDFAESDLTLKEMGEMVREINEDQVNKDEQLSDHIYEYDKDRRILKTVKESKEISVQETPLTEIRDFKSATAKNKSIRQPRNRRPSL